MIKSHGDGPKEGGTHDSAAEIHAGLRLADGFDIDQMVSEYRALRASVIKLWSAQRTTVSNEDLKDLTRFNEALDQAITESLNRYTKRINHSRNMFLGILSHDLRNPLGAASMAAQLMVAKGTLDPKLRILAAQIIDSTARASIIINDLLDLTRIGLGAGLTIMRAPTDIDTIAQQIVDELRVVNQHRIINLKISGNMHGEWDRARIGQAFSNLIGNAIQYSFKETPINITIVGDADDVEIAVHNEGNPIPVDKMGRIFDALTRGTAEGEEQIETTNLGLGLYITQRIVTSHGGTINVVSSEKDGTTFTIKLPRSR